MKNINKLIITMILVFTSFGCGSNQSASNSAVQSNTVNQPSKADQPAQTASPLTEENAIVVMPDQLSKEYKGNKKSADIKYLDKIVEVSAKVESIDTVAYTTVFLVAQPWRIGCVVQDSESAKAGNLKEGQQVTMIGKVAGPEARTIYFDQCRIK